MVTFLVHATFSNSFSHTQRISKILAVVIFGVHTVAVKLAAESLKTHSKFSWYDEFVL